MGLARQRVPRGHGEGDLVDGVARTPRARDRPRLDDGGRAPKPRSPQRIPHGQDRRAASTTRRVERVGSADDRVQAWRSDMHTVAPVPEHPDYGIDAPGVVRNLFVVGAIGWLVWGTVALGLWSGQLVIPFPGLRLVFPLAGMGLGCG